MEHNEVHEVAAGFLVLAVDSEGGEMDWLGSPMVLSDAVDLARSHVETTDNPDLVTYVIPAVAAFRPTRD